MDDTVNDTVAVARVARRADTLVRALTTVGLAILLSAAPLLAQQGARGTWELNTFGRYTNFARNTNLESGVGGGARLGYFVLPLWELEGGTGFTRVHKVIGSGSENIVPVFLDLTYNHPIGWYQVLLGVGGVYDSYGASHAWGGSATAGVRLPFGPAVALRADGLRDLMSSSGSVDRHSDWGLRLGLSWMFFPRGPVRGEQMSVIRGEPVGPALASASTMPAADTVTIQNVATERPRRIWIARVEPSLVDRERRDAERVAAQRGGPTANVHFDFGQSRIRPDAAATLEQLRELMRTTPALRVRVEGHADARGPSAYNVALSQRRAEAVKLWLVERGIDADRIETASFGDKRPLCRENEEACWARNRRDELLIVAGGDVAVLLNR
jgi:peptidoglycan-associated lipoprotein